MPNPKNFETCVIHAIASHACMSISPGPNIFTYRYMSETGNHERLNAEVVNSMHRLEENQVDILNQIQDYRDATISTASYSNNQMMRKKQGHQSTMDQAIAVGTPTAPAKPLISSISSMSELFYNWYLFKMYSYEPADKFERGKLKKLSKFIMYLRSFSTTPMLQERHRRSC